MIGDAGTTITQLVHTFEVALIAPQQREEDVRPDIKSGTKQERKFDFLANGMKT